MSSIKKRVYGLLRGAVGSSDDPAELSNALRLSVPGSPRAGTTAQSNRVKRPVRRGTSEPSSPEWPTATAVGSDGSQHRSPVAVQDRRRVKPAAGATGGNFIANYLDGSLKKRQQPEIYFGKTGVDLPVLQLEHLSQQVYAACTGPDGGLTNVPALQRTASSTHSAAIANLDDEFDLDADSICSETAADAGAMRPDDFCIRQSPRAAVADGADAASTPCCSSIDWLQPSAHAYGQSISLYEKHPFLQKRAGEPVADVYGCVARRNHCVLALADGVNWGEGARLAARCAVRAAVEHADAELAVVQRAKWPSNVSTVDVFHTLLAAFHTAHQLILQEGGLLTTLCVAVAAKLRLSRSWALCVCNVGDSLCFVHSRNGHVLNLAQVTFGSHDIGAMRDMRDAGGALGPVDGLNPELHNLTCSMTFVDEGDIVFITSDGVSDNFDPVVGKFCVIKEDAENLNTANGVVSHSAPPTSVTNGERMLFGKLPPVTGRQRHELMLLRMEDLLKYGAGPSTHNSSRPSGVSTAQQLVDVMINFAQRLTAAKRRFLEDPDLYREDSHMSKSEQRRFRRQVKTRLSEMPGKLDHASAVAYTVGVWPGSIHPNGRPMSRCVTPMEDGQRQASVESNDDPPTLALDDGSVDLDEGQRTPTGEDDLLEQEDCEDVIVTECDADVDLSAPPFGEEASLTLYERADGGRVQSPSTPVVETVEFTGPAAVQTEFTAEFTMRGGMRDPRLASAAAVLRPPAAVEQCSHVMPIRASACQLGKCNCCIEVDLAAGAPHGSDHSRAAMQETVRWSSTSVTVEQCVVWQRRSDLGQSVSSHSLVSPGAPPPSQLQQQLAAGTRAQSMPPENQNLGGSGQISGVNGMARVAASTSKVDEVDELELGDDGVKPFTKRATIDVNALPSATGAVEQNNNSGKKSKKKHARGSAARHTVGVDMSWLRKIVPGSKQQSQTGSPTKNSPSNGTVRSWRSRLRIPWSTSNNNNVATGVVPECSQQLEGASDEEYRRSVTETGLATARRPVAVTLSLQPTNIVDPLESVV